MFLSATAYAQSSEPLCQFWNAHKTPSVAYQPGVDVHGKSVAPADINAPSLLPSRVTFPVSVDMAKAFNIPAPEGMKPEAGMGMIDAYTDGRIMYNGKDLSAQAQTACAGEEKKPAPHEEKEKPEPPKAEPPKAEPAAAPPAPQSADAPDIIWGEGH